MSRVLAKDPITELKGVFAPRFFQQAFRNIVNNLFRMAMPFKGIISGIGTYNVCGRITIF